MSVTTFFIRIVTRYSNAWFNSTYYHAPRAYPRGFAIFFSFGGLFPIPGHAERDNSPPPGLFIDHKYVVLCTKHRFPYNSKTRRFDKNLRWSYTQKVNFFRKELCGRLLSSFYRDSRPDFKPSLFRSHDIIVND